MAFIAENGAVGTPSFTFASDTQSGMYATTNGFSLTAANNGLGRFHSADGVYLGYSATSTYPGFRLYNSSGSSGVIELNSYHQGVSTSAFAGITVRHQYVTGTSDRSVGNFGFYRADAISGSQLSEFRVRQRITNAASVTDTAWTTSSGDFRVGDGTYPSYNISLDASAGVIYQKGIYAHPDNDDLSAGEYTQIRGATAGTSTSVISFSIANTGQSFDAFIGYVWWYGGNTNTAAVPTQFSFVIRNGGAGPAGHIYALDTLGATTLAETYNSGTNAFDITLTSTTGSRPYGNAVMWQVA